MGRGDNRNNRNNKRRFGSGKTGSQHYGPTPRRGPPAIFVTCETGRERKAAREALDLIHYYYYSSRGKNEPSMEDGAKGEEKEEKNVKDGEKGEEDSSLSAKVKPSKEEEEEESQEPLSLEEELAMLRKGAAAEEVLSYEPNSKRPRTDNGTTKGGVNSMKSPFSTYDLGVRGMVCILCTLPGSEMIPYDAILAEIKANKEENENEDDEDKTTTKDETENEKKRVEKNTVVDEERGTKKPDPSTIAVDYTGKPLWDAVETVRCILRDAEPYENKLDSDDHDDTKEEGKNNNDGEKDDVGQEKEEKEKDTTETALLSKEKKDRNAPGSRFITRIIPMQATCYGSVEEIKAVTTSLLKRFLSTFHTVLSKKSPDEAITFKVEIKRRLTSHLKRDDIIGAITPCVYGGMEEWLPGRTFKVNLSDPDFSIRVETIKGLCGVSILERGGWYKKFNLAELTNPLEEEDGK